MKENKKDFIQKCVFIHIYATDGMPYKKYLETEEKNKTLKIPMALFQLRFDGSFGVPGGKVDEGETLIQALKREVMEEINYKIKDENKIKPLAFFKKDGNEIHSYSYEVSFKELKSIRDNATKAEHSISECSGYNLVHCMCYEKEKGLPQFLKNNFCATAKEEFLILLKDVLKITL